MKHLHGGLELELEELPAGGDAPCQFCHLSDADGVAELSRRYRAGAAISIGRDCAERMASYVDAALRRLQS